MNTIQTICKECGNVFDKPEKEHRRSIKLNRPEFCSRTCNTSHRNKNLTPEERKNFYDISKHAGCRKDEYSSFRYFITKSKDKGRVEHYGPSNIDLQYLKDLWKSQSGLCAYTKIKLYLPETTQEFQIKKSLKKASLDRIDSSKGYIKGNVEFVCSAINLAKNSFTREEMTEFIKEIKNAGDVPGVFESGGPVGERSRVSETIRP